MKENLHSSQSIHAGKNIKRIREILGIKQEALAITLGEDWNQQRISLLEKRKDIDISLLERVSDALEVPIEAIININQEQLHALISNSMNARNSCSGQQHFFDPVQQCLELLDENKKLTIKLIKAKKKLIKCLLNRCTDNT